MIIIKDGEIEEDVEYKIKAKSMQWRLDSRVFCDRCISTRLKKRIYRAMIIPSMTYGAECWSIKKLTHAQHV